MNKYLVIKGEHGRGGNGVVYKARVAATKELVAIKKLHMGADQGGTAIATIREIKFLQEMEHPNIVKVREVFVHNGDVNMVCEFIPVCLFNVIASPRILNPGEIKNIVRMVLLGLDYCHRSLVVHRDIKPGNIMINTDGIVKLIDFGLAKSIGSPNQKLTPQAATANYRAPEMLFSSKSYGTAVDMWALGCVMAEMYIKTVVFDPTSDLNHLTSIMDLCGSPSPEAVGNLGPLAQSMNFPQRSAKNFSQHFKITHKEAAQILASFLCIDPVERIKASQALEHAYFKTPPNPADLRALVAAEQSESKAKAAASVHRESRPVSGRTLSYE